MSTKRVKEVILLVVFSLFVSSFTQSFAGKPSQGLVLNGTVCKSMPGTWKAGKNGTCTITSMVTFPSSFTIDTGDKLQVNSNGSFTNTAEIFVNSGASLINNGTFSSSTVRNYGAVTNYGTFTSSTIFNNAATFSNSGTFNNNGTFNNQTPNSFFENISTFVNAYVFNNVGQANNNPGSSFTNTLNSIVNNNSSGFFRVNQSSGNPGSTFTNNGTVTIQYPSIFYVYGNGTLNNSATGTFNSSGTTNNDGTVNNYGLLANTVYFSNYTTLNNKSSGIITNSMGGSFFNNNNLSIINNEGTITNTCNYTWNPADGSKITTTGTGTVDFPVCP